MVEVQRFTAKEKIKREYKLLDNSASIQCSNSLVYFVFMFISTQEKPLDKDAELPQVMYFFKIQ